MFIALALTLLLVLSVLRHILEPSCPSCTAKRWSSQPGILSCTECGWSSVVTPQAIPGAELSSTPVAGAQYAGSQYEICFH